jgi:predicted tellurium resistance membrane protein TerC
MDAHSAATAATVATEMAAGGAFDPAAWLAIFTTTGLIALATLTALEIVLGIDNIVFLSVLTSRLPPEDRPKARQIGLMLAMGMRIVLLMFVGWLMSLTTPILPIPFTAKELSGKDLILLGGGLFLLWKSVHEIHHKVEGVHEAGAASTGAKAALGAVLIQIVLIDLVFSLDSVITAVGMTKNIPVMIVAVVSSVLVMMLAAKSIGDFVERHPAVKILALAFLVLIGVMLVAESWGTHVEKGYIYFAMAFALVVELLQIRMQAKSAAKHP